ncbi:hypothetical protein B7494_g8576 [Chlorociboria aeruginascens]|nr:hypothetical protein B7494_g8576 [Chlorociboria aeruginascens]
MSDQIIEQATTLRNFIDTAHPFTASIDIRVRDLILLYAAPKASLSASDRGSRNSGSLQPLFPVQWAESKRSFKAAVARFAKLFPFAPTDTPTSPTEKELSPPVQQVPSSYVPGGFDELATQQRRSSSPSLRSTASEQQSTTDSSIPSTPSTPSTPSDAMSDRDVTPRGPSVRDASSHSPSVQTPEPGLSATMRTEIADLIAAAFDRRDAHRRQPESQNSPRVRTLSPTPAANANDTPSPVLKTDDIGYFNPDLTDDDVMTSTSKIIYNEVYTFSDRLAHLSTTYGEAKVRTMFPTCLRGAALTWHSVELTSFEREYFAMAPVSKLIEALIKRFKEPAAQAVKEYMQSEFGFNGIRSGQTLRAHAQKMFLHARAAGVTSTYNQLLAVWNSLESGLRLHVPQPSETTTMADFLQQLDEKQHLFRDFAADTQQQITFSQGRYPPRGSSGPRYGQFPHNRNNQFHRANIAPTSSQRPSQFPLYPSMTNQNQRSMQTQPRHQQNTWNVTPKPYAQGGNQRHQQYTGNTGSRESQMNQGNMRALPSNPQRLQITAQNASASRNSWNQHQSYPTAAFANDDSSSDPNLEHHDYNELDSANIDDYQDEHYDHNDDFDSEPVAQFSRPTIPEHMCRRCDLTFPSKNKLHLHLRKDVCVKPKHIKSTAASSSSALLELDSPETVIVGLAHSAPVITSNSNAALDCGTGYGFRKWHYVTAQAKLDLNLQSSSVCLDTGCSLSLIDKAWLLQSLPDVKIRKMAAPIMVRGISDLKHPTTEYIVLVFYLEGEHSYACITREVHLVDNLQAKMLIGVDILGPERIDISITKRVATVGQCDDIDIPLRIMQRGPRVARSVLAQDTVTVPPRSKVVIPVHHIALPDRDFIFEPAQTPLTMFAHLVDKELSGIIAQNDSDAPVQVECNLKLGLVQEFDFDCYFACLPTDDNFDEMNALAQKFPAPVKSFKLSSDVKNERVLQSGVTVYGDNDAAHAYQVLLDAFPGLFTDKDCIDLPEEEWMKIELKPNWQELVRSFKPKIYTVGTQDKDVIDTAFDKLHGQNRMSYTTQNTSLTFPVFVVYRTLPSQKRVGRAVVDIRALNIAAVSDAYPLPLQSDIIAMCQGCKFISAIDATSFFYQWRVHPESRRYLSVITHRGQETFNVAIMGFKNSPAYCQRKMDSFLRGLDFTKAYVDDVIVASRTFDQHLQHLRQVFSILQDRHITVKPEKMFLGFPSAVVLGQKVTGLGLSTTEERLAAIRGLAFPKTLKDLETYLGMTGYLRQYIKDYAMISRPLENRKTLLLKLAPTKGRPRQNFSKATMYSSPTAAELNSFRTLQKTLASPRTLVHYDPYKQLFADIDASKHGIGVMIYHVKPSPSSAQPSSTAYIDPADDKDRQLPTEMSLTLHPNIDPDIPHVMTPAAQSSGEAHEASMRSTYPRKSDIEPVMFLSRKLNTAEEKYWPTEMEMTAVIWTARKIKHYIESTRCPPVVFYVDHGPLVGASQHSSLTRTTSVSKLNLKLVRASEFLSTLPIKLYYKPGKSHVVPDALSRLPTVRYSDSAPLLHPIGELDALHASVAEAYVCTASLISMAPELKNRMSAGYSLDTRWSKILQILKAEAKASDLTDLPFELHDNLIYRKSQDGIPRRLCVPSNCLKDIFTEAHDQNGHPGFAKLHDIIHRSFFIRGIARHLKDFLKYCPQCEVYQTKRHAPFGSLQPIISPPVPFHTITIDFILALPLSSHHGDKYNAVLSVTCKFSKRVALAAGHTTWKASQWASALIFRLIDLDWGLPKVILSDRGPQFLSELWQSMFDALGTKLIFSTAYHPQTDGQSERTNQTVELALRFLFHTLVDISKWPEYLPLLQHHINNSFSASTGRAPNEVVMGFTPNDVLHLLTPDSSLTKALHTPTLRIDVSDSIADASMMMKYYYDQKHTQISLNANDKVFIKLHKGYSIPSATSHKLHQQRVGPFTIIEKVGQLAYRLDIPKHWRVHDVFSIAQLEPCAPGDDPYQRPRPDHPDSVFVEGDDENNKSFVVDRILSKRKTPTGQVRYLVRWKGYGPEYDMWYSEKRLSDAKELVKEFNDSLQ